jgi:glycosyltransferase involved in cell wall biosynthesis
MMADSIDRLMIVVPVYNEESSVGGVVEEWTQKFASLGVDYELLLLNDGSSDLTGDVIDGLARRDRRIRVIHKNNTGHGQTCLHGYRLAVSENFGWIFQIDSDGQCDPQFFAEVWRRRTSALAVFGKRVHRDDGRARILISRCVRWTVLMAAGVAVPDPNVPYRLIRSDVLRVAIQGFPADFGLANILLAAILQKGLRSRLAYVDIGFRRRQGGTASVKWFKFASEAVKLIAALRQNREQLNRSAASVAAIR